MKYPSRTYWHDALLAGGFTAIPRWTLGPYAGVAEHEITIPADLASTLWRLSDELDVSVCSIVLAAHARVLAALSGEQEVATGYLADAQSEPVLCRLTTAPKTWRDFLQYAGQVETEVMAHSDFPIESLKRELGVTDPLFETMFDPTGTRRQLHQGIVIAVGFLKSNSGMSLRVTYRADAIDGDHAKRLAGYHLTALNLIAADVDAPHEEMALVSDEEKTLQIDGMAGPARDLPDSRVHELFEHLARVQPDAVAVVHGGRQLTYWELNARANKVARALLARGLSKENVVAVVTERNLHWIVSVLAIFKAGGAYLPIEPRFPAERIATTLSRAGCSLVLTERDSDTTLNDAMDSLPDMQKLCIHNTWDEGHADSDLNLDIGADQLAYIYFTSGSTGEPKGAMCEHGGMLNHMLAKIDDLEITKNSVVAQVAPQCFDISLWQLISALLVGGRTHIIDQESILDVQHFVEEIVAGCVTTLQVVPSYLEVVLSYLEQHRLPLPNLRYVSVTGEALTKDLAARWFAAAPRIKLVNAYGLTETSDDTNHEIMYRVPDQDRIPLGAPINNVRVYIIDENLSLAPLGAPGEIVFSGICVGRGYINDPARTNAAFIPDPFREGERLYRSGDYGRWQADGKLEFLGRRDAQVKVRGFRVELGEVENALMEIPGVSHCAVVVTGSDRSKQLVAFYSGQRLDANLIESELGKTLPAYMVPSAFNWRASLPLTANGKTDRKALAVLAKELSNSSNGLQAPATPAERRMAAAWAEVLGIAKGHIGRQDHFFDRGGTSLTAAKLVMNLKRAVSLKDVIRNPILADLAKLIEDQTGQSGLTPAVPAADKPRLNGNGKAHTNQVGLHCAIVPSGENLQ